MCLYFNLNVSVKWDAFCNKCMFITFPPDTTLSENLKKRTPFLGIFSKQIKKHEKQKLLRCHDSSKIFWTKIVGRRVKILKE